MTPDINAILRKDPRSCRYGAPLGDRSRLNSDTVPLPLYLQRVHFVDGDYGPDGTYWGGGGEPLWCAFNGERDEQYAAAFGTRIYVRARNRREALHRVLAEFPDVTFHKE